MKDIILRRVVMTLAMVASSETAVRKDAGKDG